MLGQPFSYEVVEDDRRLVFRGELDDRAAKEIWALFDADDELAASDLTIDLGRVDFIWSIAVGALVKAQLRARKLGATLTLVTTEDSIAHRVLKITGVPHEVVPSHPDAPDPVGH